MHGQEGTVYRGLYGPHPAVLIASALLWRQRLAAWTAAAPLGRKRRLDPAAADERTLAGLQQLRFRPLIPAQTLRGYRLAAVDCIPGCTDLLTLLYQADRGRRFSVSQRPKWLPLGEELRLARVPVSRLRRGSVRMFVVHGVYTGEPIDHAYSARGRRSVAVELGDLLVELREVTGQGPGLRGLMDMAAGMAEQFGRAQTPHDTAGQAHVADPLPPAAPWS